MSLTPTVNLEEDELAQAGKPAEPCVMVVFGATGDFRKTGSALRVRSFEVEEVDAPSGGAG